MRRLKLTRMVFAERAAIPVRSLPGDACTQPGCVGELIVYSTKIEAGARVRYLECSVCGHKPEDNKWVSPIQGL